MNKALIAIIVVALAVGGWYLYSSSSKEDTMMEQDDSMMGDDGMMEDGSIPADDSMIEEDGMMKDDSAMMEGKGTYESYSADKLALATNEKVLLFFHADWCPICRTIKSEVEALGVPEGIHILEVNYDTATALKQKYGVTIQHTFVQVDAEGNAIQKFSDAGHFADAVARAK